MNKFKFSILLALLYTSSAITQTRDVQQGEMKSNHPDRKPPVFSEIDLDGSGAVTLDEFRQHQIPFGEHEEVFQRFDINQDGEISREEFVNHKPPRRDGRKGGNRHSGERNND